MSLSALSSSVNTIAAPASSQRSSRKRGCAWTSCGTCDGNSTAEPAHLWLASMWHKASACNSPCSARRSAYSQPVQAWFWAGWHQPTASHNLANSRASRWGSNLLWERDGGCVGEHSWALDHLHQAARCLVVCGLSQGSCSSAQSLSVPISTAYDHAVVVKLD